MAISRALLPPYVISVKGDQIDLLNMDSVDDKRTRRAIGQCGDGDIRGLLVGKSQNEIILACERGIVRMRAIVKEALLKETQSKKAK